MRSFGLGIGMVLAVVISWTHWHSIIWAIIDGALGWLYVVYFLVTYYHVM